MQRNLYFAPRRNLGDSSELFTNQATPVTQRREAQSCATIPTSYMFRKNQPLMSGFEWIIILFVGVIPFRAAEVIAEALGCSHLVALVCGMGVMAICILGYFAIRPMMLPD